MTTSTVHIGDNGTVLEVTVTENGVAVDLQAATTKEFLIERKDRTTYKVAASFSTDGSDGKLSYTFGDEFDVKGVWNVQVHLVFPNGEWYSTKDTFTVETHIITTGS